MRHCAPWRKPPRPHIYRGIAILPADRNASGIRWTARMDDGTRLRADTLQGIKQMIADALNPGAAFARRIPLTR